MITKGEEISMAKAKKKPAVPVRDLKGSAVFDHVRFARKLAGCNATKFAGSYMRQHTSVPNPAMKADGYVSADDFRHDYLLYNVLRKFNGADQAGASYRAEAAYKKFMSVDSGLEQINSDLTWSNLALNEPVIHHILWRAARKMERLLGPLDLEEIKERAAFSHGATMLHPRVRGRSPYKFSLENPEVTVQCASLAWSFIQDSPHWSDSVKSLTLVPGNRLTTVPKDSEIDRVIACEPTMNMYIQKGIGAVIRDRLRGVGIDLNNQCKNQELALAGSLTGSLATVDLSAASDSISLAICKLLLPEQWYYLLLQTRSDFGIMPDGTKLMYHKISSMGNGYTFELESALFWVITQACEDEVADSLGTKPHRCSVYGDDIICLTETVPALRMVLEHCGFGFNDDKSFYLGPFRESCGKHYFNGIDVSPFFIRGPIESVLDLIGLCNRLRRWMRQLFGEDDPRYVKLYAWSREFLPDFWQKPRIPDGYGDGALYGNLSEVLPTFRNGSYTASVIQVTERRVSPADKRFATLDSVFNGLGGYLQCLSDLSRRCETDLNSSETGVDRILTIPGSLMVTRCRVKIFEWSD